MKKTMTIDLCSDRLIAIAGDMIDEHNYIGALKMLNKNAELWGDDEDSLMLYAEAFDDMELNERCINGWFRFLDCDTEGRIEDLSDCYEGLAVAYMNAGYEQYAAYYYDKMLLLNDETDSESRAEIVRSLLFNEPNPLKVAYPPEEADCTDIMNSGIDKMKSSDFEGALKDFSSVPEGNPRFISARNYMAMCHIMSGNTQKAEEECRALLEKYPDDINALTTLAAVKVEKAGEYSRSEDPDDIVKAVNVRVESREIAQKLLSLDCTDPDDLYRIATVLCENRMHAEAYETFRKVAIERPFDINLLYFLAVSAFNRGKYDECFDAFDSLLTIKPEAVTASYYYNAARAAVEKGECKEMSYFYILPDALRESSLKLLAAILKLNVAEGKKLLETVNIVDLICWCFDEGDMRESTELEYLGADVAVKHRVDGLVRDILIDAFLPDELKIDMLAKLCMRNEDNEFGVVICHIFKRVRLLKLEIGRVRRKNFLKAYSNLVGHFALIDERLVNSFARAAQDIYFALAEADNLSAADDADALTAAIFKKSGAGKSVKINNIENFFDVSEERISKICGEI